MLTRTGAFLSRPKSYCNIPHYFSCVRLPVTYQCDHSIECHRMVEPLNAYGAISPNFLEWFQHLFQFHGITISESWTNLNSQSDIFASIRRLADLCTCGAKLLNRKDIFDTLGVSILWAVVDQGYVGLQKTCIHNPGVQYRKPVNIYVMGIQADEGVPALKYIESFSLYLMIHPEYTEAKVQGVVSTSQNAVSLFIVL